ncbi:hypothetical protein MHL86_09470 [Brevibacillus laterosporus]|nr:hypothetical protein [Brevibacillus laterosporus]
MWKSPYPANVCGDLFLRLYVSFDFIYKFVHQLLEQMKPPSQGRNQSGIHCSVLIYIMELLGKILKFM